MTILIAGGGIGGLTLALMLHKRGIKSVVYEQASQIREVGVGINTLPHAIKELAALDGVLAELAQIADAAAGRQRERLHDGVAEARGQRRQTVAVGPSSKLQRRQPGQRSILRRA